MVGGDILSIRETLPHRYPFLLVDRVQTVQPGEFLVAIKNVTINEPFFNGHFPQQPIMPGVLIIEALAQASGILAYWTEYETSPEELPLYLLAGVEKARFKRPVLPGDQLTLHTQILQRRSRICRFQTRACVGEELACSAEILSATRDSLS